MTRAEWEHLEVVLEQFIVQDSMRADADGMIVGDVRPGIFELAATLSAVYDPAPPRERDSGNDAINALRPLSTMSEASRRLARLARKYKTRRALMSELAKERP